MQEGAPATDLQSGRDAQGLVALAVVTALFGVAMLPAIAVMAGHGASVLQFESAGSVARSQQILAEWGAAGRRAMWWQLALDTPFAVGYGLLLAGCCAAVVGRAEAAGRPRLARAARFFVWFGPAAATADLLQNLSLMIVLVGSTSQPWPRISAIAAPTTTVLAASAAVFAALGTAATRASGGAREAPEEAA